MPNERSALHYDAVTEAWMKWVMGDELHFGWFASPDQPLADATQALTLKLAEEAALAPGLEVLDLGCGIGTPALTLAERFGVRVTGVSTSAVGVALASERAASRGASARFLVRDATDTGLPEASFDRVFSLESAHLMDKGRLFAECFRVLKPGARLALCDVALVGGASAELGQYLMMGHSPEVAARFRAAVHGTMHRAFGSNVLTQLSDYRDAALVAGFEDVEITDVSAPTKPTLERWAKNASDHHAELVDALGEAYVEDLFLALLYMSFGWGRTGGYVLMHATRPAAR